MLKKIKFKMKMNSTQLANFLEISPPTLRNWEANKIWPLWALEKCGVMDNKEEQTLTKIKEMLDEY
jgi:hypothetical protein